ncbi:MAG: 16S rRNA (cytidine(1402)-2'-O)-methyltransferase [Thermoleophilaceae bacterium]|nr:16S rRNA (cytidine(1402)-2'-O)-methyltransferase [Thermoleophilaceae bacterium]
MGTVVGSLVICPTPIGNLEDITLRAISALRDADLIACEDTRHSGVLLKRLGIDGRTISYNEQNERRRASELVQKMLDGARVALVSDAGMPLVSDPGYSLVQSAIAAGLRIEVLPGPSAAITGLVASGLPSDQWRFAGFLPRKATELDALFNGLTETLVAFESPKRVAASLTRLAAIDPQRPVAVCRELTKMYEEIVRGTAGELAERYGAEPPRGEIVLVVGASPAANLVDGREQAARAAVERLVASGARRREAARVVAELTGLRANALYGSAEDDAAEND